MEVVHELREEIDMDLSSERQVQGKTRGGERKARGKNGGGLIETGGRG